MVERLWSFVIDIPQLLLPFFSFMMTDLKYINLTPLEILTYGGFMVILVLHLWHLVNVVGG